MKVVNPVLVYQLIANPFYLLFFYPLSLITLPLPTLPMDDMGANNYYFEFWSLSFCLCIGNMLLSSYSHYNYFVSNIFLYFIVLTYIS